MDAAVEKQANGSRNMELREFTRHDWDAFGGAEAWDNGDQPLLGTGRFEDGMAWVLVLDSNGGCLVCDDAQGANESYALDRKFKNAAAARFFAELLGDPRGRSGFFRFGFKAI